MRLGTANPSTLFQRSLPIPGPEMYCLEIELKTKIKTGNGSFLPMALINLTCFYNLQSQMISLIFYFGNNNVNE